MPLEEKFPLKKETYIIIGIPMEVHKTLGKGFLEIVYKDAMEYELKIKNHFYEREKEFAVPYKGIILPRKFNADFVIFDKVVVEVKAQRGVVEENYSQTLNYLAASKCKVALMLNFGEDSLVYKRLIL